MKTALLAMLVLLASPSLARQSVPDISFDSVPDFLKLPPGTNFGEVAGVAVNSKGHVFVFTRSNSASGPAYAPAAAQLLEVRSLLQELEQARARPRTFGGRFRRSGGGPPRLRHPEIATACRPLIAARALALVGPGWTDVFERRLSRIHSVPNLGRPSVETATWSVM